MPIISRIGRRAPKVRLLVGAIYALLLAGSVTMVYPFLLMIAGSTKSSADKSEMRVVPAYLTRDASLWAKHVEGLFNESLEMMRQAHNSTAPAFRMVLPPAGPEPKLAEAWRAFLAEVPLPDYAYTVGYLAVPVSRKAVPHNLRAFKATMIERFDNDIDGCNRELGTDFVDWNAFYVQAEKYLLRREVPPETPIAEALRRFKATRPAGERYYFTPEGFYKDQFLRTQYTRDIADYNRDHGTNYDSYDRVHLDRRLPTGPGRSEKQRQDWEEFVRTILNLLWVRADPQAAPVYRKFLQAKYQDIATLNRNYVTNYTSFEDVPLIDEPPAGGLPLSDWDALLQGWKDPDTGELHIFPAGMIRVHSVDFLFRDWLEARHGTLEKANAALGTGFADWLDVLPPQEDAHWLAFCRQRGELRREFTVRNYLAVIDYIVRHGRGILNTAIYCALAVLGALLVNPLAAYALSRYRPPSSYKVLLFLMLTMAFPPMVAQIPTFLMLRELNLLNTFGALILPGLANGYSIFLLKGFFDSQPLELYESASLDGAGEFRIFWQITMSLSKPILAVIALNAFKMAYANFMFALLICQDKKMWTLMVWLYELQRDSSPGVIYASLIIAAIPIFLMFVLCQNIIMRGIVVPVEK
ncbi:MAG TPA: ABC transporter permease subunit [Phycisphaerae bacterium]|nr:ABC transporter permease subunit [Phycisphaerae bacterium]